jgi:hypothetical protein
MEENNCICCLDTIKEKPEYYTCSLCRDTFIDSECMTKLLTNRTFCPVCNKTPLTLFNINKNTNILLPEIVIDIPVTHKCTQCDEECSDINSHLLECNKICCPFCNIKESKENIEIFYQNHVIECSTDLSLKEVLRNNKLYHIS